MYSFYVTLHARPAELAAGPTIELAGLEVQTLQASHDARAAAIYACSFEEARVRLEALERMYCEPDGSFVWVSSHDEPAWQVDGNLYDRNERLLFVDLKGCCPADQFDRLLGAFGWPKQAIVFQLTREAVLIDEAEFRRYAQQRVITS